MSGKNSQAESLEKAQTYLMRADQFNNNFEEVLAKDELDKAGEMLWGIFSSYVNALHMIRTGKSMTKHNEMIEFMNEIVKATRDERLARAVEGANRAHANFYHFFIESREQFKEIYEDIMYGVKIIDKMIRTYANIH